MAIPHYPASRPLDSGDKPLLDDVFGRIQPRVSELTFANLYLFRSAHAYRLAMVGDALVVLGQGYGGEAYFLPPLTGDIAKALAVLFGDGLTLYGADESFAKSYLRDERLVVSDDRDNFDYLYLRQELAELPGNIYHKKKNRINYFASRHVFSVEPYSDRYLEGSLRLVEDWGRVHAGIESRSLALETEASREALGMADQLGLAGLVVIVAGEVRAFALGERLNRETSVCQFEKADPFLEGLYQLINREFSRLLFTDCTWVNREQDLGETNLRESKLSYHPVELIRKFRARYKS
jgi:hypothetical protein